jgi:alkylation response protein AidB-like acyl-CoA dehydrogenase
LRDGIGLFEIDPSAAGVRISRLKTWDRTHRLARVVLANAPARRIEGADWNTVEKALDMARLALVGECAGGARRVFDVTIEYIKSRIQFGRPIGGFQAIKHMAADRIPRLLSYQGVCHVLSLRFSRAIH